MYFGFFFTALLARASARVDEDHNRGLEPANNCDSVCSETGRPAITVTGNDFQSLINNCIGDDTSKCPEEYQMIPLNCWDVSNVDNMKVAFFYQTTFNDHLGCWDTSKVTDMSTMFGYASVFNQPIEWNVGKVTGMTSMFLRTDDFNQPIESWDVSEVIDMSAMFNNAINFNQQIEPWNVVKVTNMNSMFDGASEFNQCLSAWADKTGAVFTSSMFKESGCPLQSNPDANSGPWCQGFDDQCAGAPGPGPGPCTNSDEQFLIKLNGSLSLKTCEELKSGKNTKNTKKSKSKKKYCDKKAAIQNCPASCDPMCTCKDKEKKFKFDGKKTTLYDNRKIRVRK